MIARQWAWPCIIKKGTQMSRNVTKKKLTAAVCGVFLLGAGLAGCNRDKSTAELLTDAKQYQQKGDQKAALIQLKNAVAKSPEDGEARLALGALHLELGDAVSADKELRKAAALGIAPVRALPLLAKALQSQGKFQDVLDQIPLTQAQESAELLGQRGDAFLGLNKADDAKTAYEAALAKEPTAAEPRLGLARVALLHQDVDGAMQLVDEAAAKNPKNAEVAMFKGALLRAQNKPEAALAAYEQALALKPDHRSAHVEKAYLEIGMGKFEAAKADIDAAQKTTPGSLLVTYTQALLDFTQGKYAPAQESVQKILRSAPEHMPTILLAGSVELALGSTQQAEQHLRKYVEANPANVHARKLLAQALLKSAQPGDAVAALAPALKDPGQDPQLLALAGESYMQVKDFNKATSYFEKASALAPKAAVLHTSLGLSRLKQGDHDKAISELELATTLDPKSPNAGLALVQTELNLKRFDKALAAVQALEKQQPDNPQVQNMKGVVHLAKGDLAPARAAFEKALALQPTFFQAVGNLARMDLQDKKPDAAKKRFEAVLEKDKKNFGAMAALAQLAMAQGKTDEATTWLEKANTDNPDTVAPALALGSHYLRTKQAAKALTLARKAVANNATNPDLLDMQGQAQLASNDNAGALETYSKLVNVMPKSALAQMRLSSVHLALRNESAAADDLKRAVELQPDFVQARVAQVELAARRGNFDDAIGFARQAQKQSGPASALGYALEGDVLLSQKKPALALPAYQKAYDLSQAPQVMLKLAGVMQQAGKAKEALALVTQYQKQHPQDPASAMFLAEQQLADKQFKTAIALLEPVVNRAPNNVVALNNLAWAYQQEKDPRALATAEQALKASNDNPAVMDTLGWMLVEKGDTARALPLLQKAAALVPNAPDIQYHLAAGLAKSGDKAGARKELDKLLSQNRPFAQIEDARALLKTL
jgi:putative PEP-CTERM system TPR-repeat lipoprotein